MALTDKLTAIADAIRAKTGGTDALTLDGMAEAVAGIQAGGGDDLAKALIERTKTELNSSSIETVAPYAFYLYNNFESISLPACTNLQHHAFYDCQSLRSVYLPNVTEVGASALGYSSNTCGPIAEISLPSATVIGNYAFSKSCNLKAVSIPKATSVPEYCFSSNQNIMLLEQINCQSATSIGRSSFLRCAKLEAIDLPACVNIARDAFKECYILKSVVIRNDTKVCTLYNTDVFDKCYHILGTVDSTYNPDGLKDGYIYVPDALIEDYKAATNWSTYASQIKPLSEYVEVTA